MPSTDEKITALSARTSTQAAATDVFVFVDVSDTSMAASGSDRKMTALELGRTAVAQAGGTPALTLGTAGSAGTANSLVRTDATIAAFDATVPVTQAIGDAAAAGSAAVAARRDHKHAMPSFASPTVALSSAAGAGVAATLMRSDATIAAFSTGTPATQAIGDAAAKGSVNFAARLDHKHAMPAFAAPTIALSSVASSGAAATLIKSDATIKAFSTGSPATQAMGDAAAKGSVNFAARLDHKHAMPSFGTPTVTFTTAQGAGAATTPLRSDAVLAVFSTATPQTQAIGDAASKGTAAFAARVDHKHAMPSAANLMTAIQTVDGTGSGLDADLLDGSDSTAFLKLVSGGASVENIGAVESNVETASVSTTKTADTSVYGVFDYTMTGNTTFTFSNPAPSGKNTTFVLRLSGAFTPTFPAAVKWPDATAPTYSTPTIYVFTTMDAGTTWDGQSVGKAFG